MLIKCGVDFLWPHKLKCRKMLFNPGSVFFVLGLVFVWLVALTVLFYRLIVKDRVSAGNSDGKDWGSVLEEISKEQKIETEKIGELIKKTDLLEKQAILHIQKVGLVRFNPFSDTGGDQSFTLAVLDGECSGIVITSLHSRDNTRIYAKPVEKGKPTGFDFSDEELEAIKRASKS